MSRISKGLSGWTSPAVDAVVERAVWDRIAITGITGIGHHGVFEYERVNGQRFVVDVVLHVDTRAAAASDDLTQTVDYGMAAQLVMDRITGPPVQLIETLAEQIAADLLELDGVEEVEVSVHKPQAPIPVPFDDVELRIQRRR